jgi:hypothetical protein
MDAVWERNASLSVKPGFLETRRTDPFIESILDRTGKTNPLEIQVGVPSLTYRFLTVSGT